MEIRLYIWKFQVNKPPNLIVQTKQNSVSTSEIILGGAWVEVTLCLVIFNTQPL